MNLLNSIRLTNKSPIDRLIGMVQEREALTQRIHEVGSNAVVEISANISLHKTEIEKLKEERTEIRDVLSNL